MGIKPLRKCLQEKIIYVQCPHADEKFYLLLFLGKIVRYGILVILK